jgi:hypothetical protein
MTRSLKACRPSVAADRLVRPKRSPTRIAASGDPGNCACAPAARRPLDE